MDLEKEIMVSVVCITYNHELFIEQAIQSILSQKTSFKFELIIHDDASPDNTQAIIKEYAEKYPSIIRPVLQKENQYSKGKGISQFYVPLCRGKYYAYCEGDDYWVDPYKLQKQVEYLESNPSIPAVSGRYNIIDKSGNIIDVSHRSESLDRVFGSDDALRLGPSTLHPNTIMMRMSVQKSEEYMRGRRDCCILGGHTFMIYYLCSHGGVYIMSGVVGAWRRVIEENGTSYASRSNQHPITYNVQLLDMYTRYRTFFGAAYNFNDRISELALGCVRSLITQNEVNVKKTHELVRLLNLLTPSDKARLIKLIIQKAQRRLLKYE